MRHIYFLTGVAVMLLMLGSCPAKSSINLGLDEKIDRIVYWSAEFGYNCALAGILREDMHKRLRERKEVD